MGGIVRNTLRGGGVFFRTKKREQKTRKDLTYRGLYEGGFFLYRWQSPVRLRLISRTFFLCSASSVRRSSQGDDYWCVIYSCE